MINQLKTAARKNAPHALLLVAASFLAASCAPENAYVAPPPPEVDVAEPDIRDTTVFLEFPGSTEAFQMVEIRARVRGFLKSIDFQAGEYVEKDKGLLFTIEPEEFEAAVKSAEGNLDKADADFKLAKTNSARQRDVFEKSAAVSEINVLSAEAEMKAAQAAISIRDAELTDAKRNLGYTKIVSPGSGRVSKNFVDLGNLVGAADPTLLTTVVQIYGEHWPRDPVTGDLERAPTLDS
jgi:RND family efflux transporter MFP subunit